MALLGRVLHGRLAMAQAGLIFFLTAILFFPILSIAQDSDSLTEYRIKAAYLFRFCEYVDWPESAFSTPSSSLIIGILGSEQIAEDMEQIVEGRQVNGRSIHIRRIQTDESIRGIHVLFIDRTQEQDLTTILTEARTQSILTVTEWEDFNPTDSIINFVVVDNRVRFDVALQLAEKSNIRISSRLLTVARNVINEAS